MENKTRYMTPQQYADMKEWKLDLVEWMMQPSRTTKNMFHPQDIDRSSPRHPRLVYRRRDAAGVEYPRVIPRKKSVHVPRGRTPVKVNPVEDAAIAGVTHPGPKDVNGDIPLRVKRRKRVAKRLNVKRSDSKRGLGSKNVAAK